jgi:hypothetical protein
MPLAVPVALSATLLLCSCGSAPASLAASCQKVAAVLSDGPDPVADPVGYAEAQVQPLRQLDISDRALKTAVSTLASAYAAYYQSNGGHAQATARNSAQNGLLAVCPGVFG